MAKYCKGHSCIAPNCKSGYKSEKSDRKIHFFSVPMGKENLEKWQRAILRENFAIRPGQVVCEKHFRPEDILWKREVKDPSGKVMASMDYKIPRLKKGIVPSIFPNCPKYLTKIVKERKPPTQRDKEPLNSTHSSNTKSLEKDDLTKAENFSSNSKILSPNIEENEVNMDDGNNGNYEVPIHEPTLSSSVHHEDLSETERFAFFDSLISSKNSFDLPETWVRYDIDSGEIRAIEFSQCTAKLIDDKVKTIHHKKIILCRDMRVHTLVMNCSLENKTVGLLKPYVSSAEVEDAIKTLHKLEICQGLASPSSFICNSTTSFTFKDSIGTLRHNKCSLILDPSGNKSKLCQSCEKGKVTLSKKHLTI
ncbi:THAP domain-containing protein 5-like [Leptopilina heterotoma]|uniref:THAP domain-containing protein 5-like n=1 Tax=Leptopilina heterotoma TaxID=63436 RepID=UPI001CA90C95|nr:THAP domain-containing protein 5-like [Leptopilina heterotoma]